MEKTEPQVITETWTNIQRKFDQINDIDEKFYFLRDLVDMLHICENAQCPIFPNLYNLDLSRMNYQYKTLIDAKAHIKNQLELQKFEREYFKFITACKRVFAEIYALKVSTETKRIDQDKKDAKFKEYLQLCAKYGLTPELKIQSGIESIANSYAGGSLPLSTDELSDKKKLESHVKKLKEKEKKKDEVSKEKKNGSEDDSE